MARNNHRIEKKEKNDVAIVEVRVDIVTSGRVAIVQRIIGIAVATIGCINQKMV